MTDKIYIKGKGYVELTYEKEDVRSTHIDKPQRDYEIWSNCRIDGKETDSMFFVIKNYKPWIDNKVLSNPKPVMDYTQDDNKIIETYKISKEMIVTKFYDWYPSVIKSANNFYSKDTFLDRGKKHLDFFSSKINSDRFYRSVIDEYKKLNTELGLYSDDIAPNNFIVNDDYTDFRIIDVVSFKEGEFKIDFPYTQIIHGDGSNDIGFVNPQEIESSWVYNKNDTSTITFCISTYNNFDYLKLAVKSVRENSYFKNAPFVIHAENCDDGTNEWLEDNKDKYNLEIYIEPNNKVARGIGGGMDFVASKVKTEFINFIHSDFYVSRNWDIELLKVFDKYPSEPMMVFSHRVQPNIFNEKPGRPGTHIVPCEEFGEYHHNFDEIWFLDWCEEFSSLNDFEIRKGEGVSGLIRKSDWDCIGGNDPLFAPASWEDMDLFIRMQLENYKIVLTPKSVVYHFGARGSHFPTDDFTVKSDRQVVAETTNAKKWWNKWGVMPVFDEVEFIKVTDDYIKKYKEIKNG